MSAASVDCDKQDPKGWLKIQQLNLKEGNLYLVLQELEKNIYQENVVAKDSVVSCYKYLNNRLDQLDYLGAILEELPIGSSI